MIISKTINKNQVSLEGEHIVIINQIIIIHFHTYLWIIQFSGVQHICIQRYRYCMIYTIWHDIYHNLLSTHNSYHDVVCIYRDEKGTYSALWQPLRQVYRIDYSLSLLMTVMNAWRLSIQYVSRANADHGSVVTSERGVAKETSMYIEGNGLLTKVYTQIDGILPKGPYPSCLRMADRALLAGYP